MAHLASSFSSYSTFLEGADAYWSVDLGAMNNSGITGTAVLAVNTEDDGTRYLNISIAAEGLTPNVQHAQHVHGTFDGTGTPTDARMPDLTDDADKDGFVEVFEGLGAYGDILLPLVNSSGALPTTDANGQLVFIQSYELGDDSNFFSPVTGNDYTADDLMPLEFREIVLHGQNVGSGFGAGTTGEIDGTQDGYVGLLPVAAGEIESTNKAQAVDMLEDQFQIASDTFRLAGGNDDLDAGAGNDRIFGGKGTDRLNGGADDDRLFGGADNDILRGDSGDDFAKGGAGNDRVEGGDGNDRLSGQQGADTILGGSGNDVIRGNRGSDELGGNGGADRLFGGAGNDFITGGNGRDIMAGGGGWDEFIYNDMSEGNDVIRDFDDVMDLINVSALGIGFDDITVTSAEADASSMLSFGSTTILLQGITTDMVDAGDFVF
ncbi:calcium-binding protein [Arenibacterium halophilum]|uniref:Calcium-binding protein n=1 Tax=Arenibacterium halophilum TaxID=2583821 RepID=A0ABY2XAN5_9RHOB|nr:calcium-binding protein [Arenibacterium halophilum]TMV12949.1 calcium-binding protein [Arenibacterium halophilum]